MELGAHVVGVDDSTRSVGLHSDEFEERTVLRGTEDQEACLKVVLLLHGPERVPPCVQDVGIGDPVLPGAVLDPHRVKATLTPVPTVDPPAG